jgi:uncharacterized protein (DUF302 family)/predicted Fe-Mo cluster-binding NifX family protein
MKKIAVTSQNFRTVTGHAGKARRFLILDDTGRELDRLDLPKEMSFHEWHGADDAPHPLDGVDVLITAGAGQGFRQRLARRGIRVEATGEGDPATAVRLLLAGQLPPPRPEEDDHHEGHEHPHPHTHHHSSAGVRLDLSPPSGKNDPSPQRGNTMYASSIQLTIPFKDFDDAVEQVKAALMAEKMGVVSDVNVQAIFQAKMGLSVPGYRILGACVPPLAKRVIDADPEGGALLPCNVIVRADAAGQVFVTIMDPKTVLGLAGNPEIDRVAEEATTMLAGFKARLGG